MPIETTLKREVEELVVKLAQAGVPPPIVAIELMAVGAGLLRETMGDEHLRKQCQVIASAVDNRQSMH